MKHRLVGAIALLCVGGGAGRAQDTANVRPVSLGVMLGAPKMTGSYDGAFKTGVALGVDAFFPLPARRLAIRADVMYHIIGEHTVICLNQPGGQCSDQGTSSQLISTSADLLLHLNDPTSHWSPYVLVGAAYYVTGAPADEKLKTFDPRQAGYQFGIGTDVHSFTGATLFVELRYMSMPPGGVVPLTVGLRF
jgi:hypothetical protein